ncbi:MAG: LCP family protein [Clostridiales bacterium]|nr:LCP family protein [Clostridiales bacterium]
MDNGDEKYYNPDERDRTVPPEENYYQKSNLYSDIDLNFNSRQRSDVQNEIINHQGDGTYSPDAENYMAEEPAEPRRVSRGTGNNNTASLGQPGAGKQKKSRKKASKTKKRLIAALIIILILLVLPGLLVNSVLSRIIYDDREEDYVSSSELYSDSSVKNILLLGVDARSEDSDDSSRSDSMILVSIDSANNCIKMTSFLRDTWLYIPCLGYNQRLNAACRYGGYQGVVDAIEYNYGIEIEGYVVTDFEMFQIMVDSIGGIEIEITEAEANEVTNHPSTYGDVTLEAGTQTLSGEQALAYCRIRKVGTDWARTERQRTVMQEILSELLSSNPFTAFKTVFNVAPYIETNLSKSEIISAALKALFSISGGFETAACPFDGTWSYSTINGADVITIDLEANREELINFIYSSD